MDSFYQRLLSEEKLDVFFSKFHNPKILFEHLNILVDFWENNLFYTGNYQRNAMAPHLLLHRENPIQLEHFDLWLKYFYTSVDEHFSGEIAHTMKTRALSIATVMKIKIAELNK